MPNGKTHEKVNELCFIPAILLFWGLLFGIEYCFLGWWTLGGVFPIFSHLILDKVF